MCEIKKSLLLNKKLFNIRAKSAWAVDLQSMIAETIASTAFQQVSGDECLSIVNSWLAQTPYSLRFTAFFKQ
jgi:hypothetical protein